MALKAAWTSAAETVQMIGWSKRISDRYWEETEEDIVSLISRRDNGQTDRGTERQTCPCQSVVLIRMMDSGSWSSENRMWFSWSKTDFLATWQNTQNTSQNNCTQVHKIHSPVHNPNPDPESTLVLNPNLDHQSALWRNADWIKWSNLVWIFSGVQYLPSLINWAAAHTWRIL